MFDQQSVDLEKDPHFFLEVKEQVLDVCEEMGKVDKVWVEQNSNGNVWIRFSKDSLQGAKKARDSLHDRFFDGRKIRASFVPENVFNSKVPESCVSSK